MDSGPRKLPLRRPLPKKSINRLATGEPFMRTRAQFDSLPRMRFKHFLNNKIIVLLLSVSITGSVAQPYTVLKDFPETIGSWPGVTLLTTGTNIFGTSSWGGSSNLGMIF